MRIIHTDIFIIGAGAAGMAAALAAEEKGYKDILIAERGERAGGVLLQCAHKGFGLGFFGEDLTGMEYAARFRMYLTGSRVKVMFGTMVLKLYENKRIWSSPNRNQPNTSLNERYKTSRGKSQSRTTDYDSYLRRKNI